MTSEGTVDVTLVQNQVYFHGFWVNTTGTYNKIRLRIGNNTLIPAPGPNGTNTMKAAYIHTGVFSALYPSTVGVNGAHISKPMPNLRISQGKFFYN